ncbi:hypothetical protein N824_28605 [Pedobacter sp. V48]|nr:hypothetical protein N824_28605 [Pedobacter sp. V48]
MVALVFGSNLFAHKTASAYIKKIIGAVRQHRPFLIYLDMII